MNNILYNVSIELDAADREEWLSYMQDVHIPDVMKAGYFESYQLAEDTDAPDGKVRFQVSYTVASMERYEAYRKEAAAALQDDHTKRFAGRFRASRQVLYLLEEG